MNVDLPKTQRDALLILYFKIDRPVGSKEDIEGLLRRELIDALPGGGWRVNGAGRALVRKMM